jgi:hypothetical protein
MNSDDCRREPPDEVLRNWCREIEEKQAKEDRLADLEEMVREKDLEIIRLKRRVA